MRLLTVLIVTWAWVAPALACSLQVGSLLAPKRVPADGSFAVLECYAREICRKFPQPSVRDAAGNDVPGQASWIEGLGTPRWIWKPETPLTPGQRYTMTLDEGVLQGTARVWDVAEQTFEAVAELPAFSAQQRVEATLSLDTVDADRVCCPNRETDVELCWGHYPRCVPGRKTARVRLQMKLFGFDDANAAWLFWARPEDGSDDDIKHGISFSRDPDVPYGEVAFSIDDYRGRGCFSIIARSLRDGSEVVAYEDCIDQFFAFPPDQLTPQAEVDAFLRTCASYDGGVPAADASVDAGVPAADASVDEPATPRGDEGCQLTSASPARGWLTWLAMATIALMRRRRRARS